MDYFTKSTEVEISHRKLEGYLKLAQIIQWGRGNPIGFCEQFLGIEFLDVQKWIFMNTWTKPNNLWCITRNGGKALALDTKIPTPTGYKTMQDIHIGDYVISEKGLPTKVIMVSPIFYDHDCYKITFEDGETIIADENHLWYCKVKDSTKKYKILKTSDMIHNFKHMRKDKKGQEFKYRVPMNNSIEYKEKKLLIDPYVLGVWLGDGNSRDTRVTVHSSDLNNLYKNILEKGYNVHINKKYRNCYNINIGVSQGKNEFKINLRKMNLLQNKHIPNIYMFSSVQQRWELLRGLMDTDGSCYGKNNSKCEFSQKNKELIKQVGDLLTSLGIKYSIITKELKGQYYYRIIFYTDKNNSCFKLKRKYNRLKDKLNKRMNFKSIINIQKVQSVPTKCIMVDNPTKLYLCGEHGTVTHNSTLTAPFIMAKGILITGHKTYILSNVSAQSQDTFMKIEDIAKKNITSFAGLTDFFKGEVITSTANKDGFTHAQSGFNYKLFNGSQVTSLSGDANNNRGKRSNLNIYDESGWITEEYISATTPFLLQNNDFKIGGGVDTETLPQQIPNQNLFISSASSTDSQFYKYYKEYSKKMLLGNRNYFVADIDCEVMLHPTSFGVTIKPLISKEKIQLDMSTNREKALREYYNKFSVDGGDGQVFKRADIIRNSIVRLPILRNDSNTKRKFVFAYDPAETRDNSVIIVAELIEDENFGDRMEICNCIVFKDLKAKKKSMIQIPEQVEELKQLLLKYNGQKFADYENIECLLIDSGEAGGGKIIGDLCMPDWADKNGIRHRGLIDKVEYKDYIKKFPNAINKIKMMPPQKYKKQLFDALSEMINQNLFSFPAEYSGKGYIMLPKETGKEIEVNNEGKITKEKEINYNKIKIDNNQGLALKNIDLAKEELVHIYRTKSSNGNYSYNLQKEVENKMHDDKAYCLALLGWYLQEIRRSRIVNKKAPKIDYSKMPSLISHISL